MSGEIRIPWPGWRLGRKLGSGSFGMVYEIDRTVGASVERAAMKVISFPKEGVLEELQSEGYPPESIRQMCDDCKDDLLREYGMMMQLKGHSNIVSCEDFTTEERADTAGFRMYIRMELLTPLRDVLRGGNLSEQEIIRLGRDLCKALIICHGREIIHRDIKPQNIFVSDFGDYKLGDFGVARRMEGTANATVAGTTNYMAPEVYRNEPYGKDADLYSLGMVLYYLLNERRMPFLPLTQRIASAQEEASALFRRIGGESIPAPANGSPALQKIVLRAVAFDRGDRYASARAMLDDLQTLPAAQAAPPAEMTSPASPVEMTSPASQPLWDAEEDAGSATVSALQQPVPQPAPPLDAETPVPGDRDETVAITGIAPAADLRPEPKQAGPDLTRPVREPAPEAEQAPKAEPALETGPKPAAEPALETEPAPAPVQKKLPQIWVTAGAAGAVFNGIMCALTYLGYDLLYKYGSDFPNSMFFKQTGAGKQFLAYAGLGIRILLPAGVLICFLLLRRQKKALLPLGILGFLCSLLLFLAGREKIYWALHALGMNSHASLPLRNVLIIISLVSSVVFMVLNAAVPYWGRKM